MKHSVGSDRAHSECARSASSLSLRLVWKRCPGRGSAANAKSASTPPLDTGNIGFEPPTGIGNSTWIVRVGFGQRPFPQTVNSPQRKIARVILPAVNYTTTERAVYFAFLNSAKAQDAYAYFLYHEWLAYETRRDPDCTAECHLDNSRKWCNMSCRDLMPRSPFPQDTENERPARGQT